MANEVTVQEKKPNLFGYLLALAVGFWYGMGYAEYKIRGKW